jgi:hypothetical protein
VGDRTALERARLVVHGDRAELRIEDGHLTIDKQAGVAASSVTIDVARVRGTQLQPPKGGTRGWLHVRVVGGSPAPPGELAAAGDPYTLPLTARGVGGAWRVAKLVERHVKARGMPREDAPTEGRWSSSVSLTSTPPPPRPPSSNGAVSSASATSAVSGGVLPPPPPPPPPAAPPPPPSPAEFVAELRELAELRDRGALTDAEFERAKARVLG